MPLPEVSGNPQEGELRAMPLMERLAHARLVAMLEDKESIEAAADRIAELEAELHAIKYEIMGGEDAPGSASMATVADVKKEIDRLRGIEFAARSLAERLYKFE